MTRTVLAILLTASAAAVGAQPPAPNKDPATAASLPPRKPNIVLILADDK